MPRTAGSALTSTGGLAHDTRRRRNPYRGLSGFKQGRLATYPRHCARLRRPARARAARGSTTVHPTRKERSRCLAEPGRPRGGTSARFFAVTPHLRSDFPNVPRRRARPPLPSSFRDACVREGSSDNSQIVCGAEVSLVWGPRGQRRGPRPRHLRSAWHRPAASSTLTFDVVGLESWRNPSGRKGCA